MAGACIARPSKIVCIGLIYARHAAETGREVPKEPVIFMKAPSSLCGAFDDPVLPKNSEKTDWEVELALVIGKRASYVSEAEAKRHVAGYCLLNDYGERAFSVGTRGPVGSPEKARSPGAVYRRAWKSKTEGCCLPRKLDNRGN